MHLSKNESNSSDLWTKQELSESKYDTGKSTELDHHGGKPS